MKKFNRLLSKLAAGSKVQGVSERKTGAYTPVCEDLSTEATQQFASAIEFRKKSNILTTWLPLLLLLPLLCSLGVWQFKRAAFKEQLLKHYAIRNQHPPQTLSWLSEQLIKSSISDLTYTRVTVNGNYDNQHTILVDNVIVNHRVGYDVLSPFIPQSGQNVLLVNRGWVPQLPHRQLPIIPPIHGSQMVIGMVHAPNKAFQLGRLDPNLETQWPLLVQSVKLEELARLLNRPTFPVLLLLTSPVANGFTLHWHVVTTMSPQRHYAYGFQWFSLAFTLVIIYVIFYVRRVKQKGASLLSREQLLML